MNNGARALEGLIARYFFDNDTSVVATLSGSLITITANRNSLTLTATTSNYVANFMQAFTMGANANTGPVRVTIDGVGPIELRHNDGVSLSSSVLISGTRALMVKDGVNNYFRLLIPDKHYWDESSATQAELEAATVTNKTTTPGRQQYHPSALKSWVRFDATAVGGSLAESYNVSALTDNGTGDFTVSFSVSMTNSLFPVAVMSANHLTHAKTGGSAGGWRVEMRNPAGSTLVDSLQVMGLVAGDQP